MRHQYFAPKAGLDSAQDRGSAECDFSVPISPGSGHASFLNANIRDAKENLLQLIDKIRQTIREDRLDSPLVAQLGETASEKILC